MILEVSKISKTIQKKLILNNLSFNIARGEIVGITGPNGSGKTTLLNLLTGGIRADGGKYQFAERIKIGAAVSRKGFCDDMSVGNNLLLFAALEGVKYAEQIGKRNIFKIDYFEKRYGILSAGMKQRVALTIPFLSHKDILLLDEPTNHLDIDSIIVLRREMLRLKEEGVSFIIAGHSLSDFEKTCDRILFMKEGLILYDNSRREILDKYRDFENAYCQIINPPGK